MRHFSSRQKWIGAVLLIVLLLAIGGRVYLPYWLKDYVNRQIASLNGYGGGVDDINVHLWRGAYAIKGLNIYKTDGRAHDPFVAAKTVELALQWDALIHGRVVAQIDIYNIDLNFAHDQSGAGGGWAHFVKTLSPFDINRLTVHSGKVAYIDRAAKPPVNIYIAGIDANVTNLRDVQGAHSRLPSELSITGRSIGNGNLNIQGHINIMKDIPDFDLDAKLENADLKAFNDYAEAAAGISFKSGTISLYSEMAAADGHLVGYVKPLLKNISVEPVKKHGANPFNIVWRQIVSAFINIFKNQPNDQFAMRVPLEGQLNDPQKDIWSAFLSIFSNAFGHAFTKNTDGSINFMDALKKGPDDKK